MAKKIHRWLDNQSTDSSDSSSPTTSFVQLLNQLNTQQTHVTSGHHTTGSSSQPVDPTTPTTVASAALVAQATDVNHPATLNFYSSTSKGFVAGAIADVKLDDPDGISGPVTYHWKSIGPFDKQWTDMPWVTTDRITLTQADAGKLFDVTATFVDDKGHAEAPEHMFKDSDPVTTPPPAPTPPPPTTSDVNHPATLNFYSSTSKGFVAGALADVKLDDPDGISGPVTYHWKFKGPNDSQWTDMPQVTGDAITLTKADAGKFFDVTATFIDDKGHAESPEHMFKDSDPVTTPPPAPTPPPPTTSDINHPATLNFYSSTSKGFVAGAIADVKLDDPDGISGPVTYHWKFKGPNDSNWTLMPQVTEDRITLTAADAGKFFDVTATFIDDKGHAEAPEHMFKDSDPVTSTPTPTPTPPPPTDVDQLGTIDVTSSPTGFAVGATVTAHVADPDGLGSGAINYHWFTVGSGNQLTPIANATGQSYTLQPGDPARISRSLRPTPTQKIILQQSMTPRSTSRTRRRPRRPIRLRHPRRRQVPAAM